MVFCNKTAVVATLMIASASRTKQTVAEMFPDLALNEDKFDVALIESHSRALQPHEGGAEGCKYPSELKEKYTDPWVIGTGATACVWIGKDAKNGGNPVALKIAKGTAKIAEWRKECADMQQMRRDACRAGGQAQQLAEQFLPTCLDVGTAGPVSYYVMQAAGSTGITDFAKKHKGNVPKQKKAFAQTVAAVQALHGIDLTHNDLHGHNIVLDANDDIALIDFGEIKGHHRGLGYKHDVNAVWRWAGELANCPENSQFPRSLGHWLSKKSKDELTERKGHLLQCLQTKWEVDEEFVTTMDMVLTDAIKITADQHIKELFDTEFVQSNLPALKNANPWDDNGKCSASGLDKKKHTGLKAPKMSGRPTKGDWIKDKTTGKCAEIIKDDNDATPFQIRYGDGTVKKQFVRVVHVAWASECQQ